MVWYGDVCILYAMHIICKHTKQLFAMGQAPGTRNLQWWPWAIAFRRRCYWAQKVIGFSWIFRGVWDDQLDLEIWRWCGRKKSSFFGIWGDAQRFSRDFQMMFRGLLRDLWWFVPKTARKHGCPVWRKPKCGAWNWRLSYENQKLQSGKSTWQLKIHHLWGISS